MSDKLLAVLLGLAVGLDEELFDNKKKKEIDYDEDFEEYEE